MLNYQGRKNLWCSAVKAVGTMVMNVIGKISYIGLQENPREKKKERKKRQSLPPQTKAPGPGHKKTAGENFALWLHI